MAEKLIITNKENKTQTYREILPQIKMLIADENDIIANLANISAVLKESFGFFWVGFYIVKDNELVLGPFQGPLACTRIKKGKGVCGFCWEKEATVIVDNVDEFPGHIACSSLSKSEIVVPIIKNNVVKLVLDVDSDKLASFNQVDKKYLEELSQIIAEKL